MSGAGSRLRTGGPRHPPLRTTWEPAMLSFKKFLPTIVAAMLIGAAAARAENYPTRPITAIVPFAGGSASDVVSRILFDRMSKSLGQPIVVENRPGAGGNSGTADAAKTAPDG